MSGDPLDDRTDTGGELVAAGAGPDAPADATPVDPAVASLWGWARGYIKRFSWTVAPMWYASEDPDRPGCRCPEGEACPNWGKHLVSGLGVARAVGDIERVWRADDPRVRAGHIGLAALTGAESSLVVLDIGGGRDMPRITRARFDIGGGHVLTQETPSGGQHWFFAIGDGEAVVVARGEFELVTGVWVLGDGGFCALEPRTGYQIVGGRDGIDRGVTPLPDAVRLRLVDEGMLESTTTLHNDEPWRTRAGAPLIGRDFFRSYNRDGDIRRLVDEYGDRITLTPGLGWRVWTEAGWGSAERSEMQLKSYATSLPRIHRREATEAVAAGKDTTATAARKWALRASMRATGSLLSDLASDERLWVPSANDWDSEGWICGLPVRAGVGRLVNLRTGEIERDALSRRVSRYLGADYQSRGGGAAGTLKRLWDKGVAGGGGWAFVKYVSDLERQYGADWVRLLQRAAGASLFGRKGVGGDTDAVFCLKGPTRSGKSTFVECLLHVAGDYAKAMNHNLLFGDRGNPEFADAHVYGYRVLTFGEPPLGVGLNTARLKALSGGDSITGRLPYGRQEISFTPECSLWLSTNHALEIADEAVWRRMRIFTFEHAIGEGEEDPRIRSALTGDPDERALALAWMVVGATAWEREGWGDTAVWDDTRGEEKAKHDPIVRWVNESLEVTHGVADRFTHMDLLSQFDWWMTSTGAERPALSKAALKDELEYAVVRRGVKWDGTAKKFVGGRLR